MGSMEREKRFGSLAFNWYGQDPSRYVVRNRLGSRFFLAHCPFYRWAIKSQVHLKLHQRLWFGSPDDSFRGNLETSRDSRRNDRSLLLRDSRTACSPGG